MTQSSDRARKAADCDLGPMHGMASRYTDANGIRCCDFCGQPVERETPGFAAGLLDAIDNEITAWAFANDIDGAARNDLMRRIRAALTQPADPTSLHKPQTSPDAFATSGKAMAVGLAVELLALVGRKRPTDECTIPGPLVVRIIAALTTDGVAAENEACAAIADRYAGNSRSGSFAAMYQGVARSIRARMGEQRACPHGSTGPCSPCGDEG